MIAQHNPAITSKIRGKSGRVGTSTTSIELHTGRQLFVEAPTAGSNLDSVKGVS
jgi:hypothetical protein